MSSIIYFLQDIYHKLPTSKIAEISEISPGDKREIRENIIRDVEDSCRKVSKDISSGKIKPLTVEEFRRHYS